ncbi:MAG: hypothetical protein K0R39_562 [Symbiobacteriaceae bacterium]|nr:hypothetical protein [Symbiobacteriaceae bacterium]
MRKVYIIRENEEDGRLLDALIAAGLSTDEGELANPVCPRCGFSTLLAFAEDDDFEVVLWEQVDPTDGADAQAWYLVCSQYECSYQEEIERVLDPMGAEVFDQHAALFEFDEYAGTSVSYPIQMQELLEELRAAAAGGRNRKLASMFEHAQWCYQEHLKMRWKWIRRVPLDKRVRFALFNPNDPPDYEPTFAEREKRAIEGTFVTPTDEGFVILRDPTQELLLVRVEELGWYQPQSPINGELPRKLTEILKDPPADRQLILGIPAYEYVVIRGHHLRLSSIDRLGQYRVRCWDPVAAAALSLTPHGENYWEGLFRRSDIQERYDVKKMIKTKGHWIDVVAAYGPEEWPYVRTDDPAVAAALGLAEQKPLRPPETDEELRNYRRTWAGGVPESEVEDRRDVRLYHWPLPEFKAR